jgi:hypothetical protein
MFSTDDKKRQQVCSDDKNDSKCFLAIKNVSTDGKKRQQMFSDDKNVSKCFLAIKIVSTDGKKRQYYTTISFYKSTIHNSVFAIEYVS